ncbi:hypothetical protein [Gymnodinialimonas hymeniacidonis]|uniref:hypothetical protein n=1 Tax=Gymnodinialimonas hymeniacidonis TaxID=3126508 RepID=UPI0034C6476F
MIRALAACLCLVSSPAAATGLACTFTQLCSPLTDCQTHPGLPFTFDLISGALALTTADGIALGTPLSHVEAPALSLLFDTRPDQTLLLSVSATGEAAMTQHDFEAAGRLTSVSYFGTCEPAS